MSSTEAAGGHCRLCATREPPSRLRSFATTDVESDSLLASIHRVNTSIQRADGLPQAACLDCVRLLEAVEVIHRRVAVAQVTLAGLYTKVNSVKREAGNSVTSSDDSTSDLSSDIEDNVSLMTLKSVKYEANIKQDVPQNIYTDTVQPSKAVFSTVKSAVKRPLVRRVKGKRKKLRASATGLLLYNSIETRVGEDPQEADWTESSMLPMYGGVPTTTRDAPVATSDSGPRWSEHWCCRRCDLRFGALQQLREHSWREHSRCVVFKCLVCSVRMFTFKNFYQHLTRHLPDLRRCCELCDQLFESASDARLHKELRHAAERASHRCHNCGSGFPTAEELKTHRDTYTVVRASTAGGNVFKCDQCPKAFPNKIGLVGHMDCHDPDKNTCNICNKLFKNKYNLKQHQSYTHNPKLRFVCQICGKGFKLDSHLKAHLNVHSDVKPWPCDTCDKKFRTKFQLVDHQVCHTGIRPHVCNICNKSYKYTSNLRIHLKSHSNVATA